MATINKVLRGLTPLTSRSIIKFIGSKEAREGIGWFTEKEFDKIIGDETSSNSLEEKLKSIQHEFEDIKLMTSMKKNPVKSDWENMQTRLFQAEMDVCHKFKLLQTILASKESGYKGDSEMKRLRKGILDPSNGVLNNLSAIHQELVGQTVNHTKKGLIEVWYNEVCNNMNTNPISARTCYDILMKNVTKAAILQLKGFLLFKGASEDSQLCLAQLKSFENNLKYQSDLMDETISDTMKYLANPSTENVFYLRQVSGVRFKPFVKRRGEGKPFIYEYHMQDYPEAKWTFQKSSRFQEDGSLIIYGRSSAQVSYIGLNKNNKAISVLKEDDAQHLFVMPIDTENSTTIHICTRTPESASELFLCDNLKFAKKKGNIKFSMTKLEDTPKEEHVWDIFHQLRSLMSKIKPI